MRLEEDRRLNLLSFHRPEMIQWIVDEATHLGLLQLEKRRKKQAPQV